MKKIKYFLLGCLGLVAAILIYGLIEPYIIDVEPQVAAIANLPPAWEGKEIAVIGDWQIGMWLANTNTVHRSVNKLIKKRPQAVLIIGDFLYGAGSDPSAEINKAIELVRPLPTAGIPTYAVLGNHDYSMKSKKASPDVVQANKLTDALKDAGVRVLQNQAVPLTLAGQNPQSATFYLVGIGSHWANKDKPETALAQLPSEAPRFVMMHHPDSFAAFPANTAPVAVAGHTHGGQIRLPFTPQWSWMSFAKEDEVHTDGWIKEYGQAGNHLYVNRGIGFSIIPIRVNCPPEVTLFTLRASA